MRHDDRGLVPRAGFLDPVAPGEHLGARLLGAVDEPRHANRLFLGDQRAHLRVIGERVSDLERADR